MNESWTVAGVLGHIAFWDGRALLLAGKLLDDQPFTPSDDEPEDVDWINDSTRPLIHAIPPRAAAELALPIAEETDPLNCLPPAGPRRQSMAGGSIQPAQPAPRLASRRAPR